MNRLITLLLFQCFAYVCYAQDYQCSDYYRYLNESKIRDHMNAAKRGTDLSVNYNLKYSRFYWKIDPDSNYIIGKVTHYFSPNISTLDVLAFELAPALMVDTVFYHGDTLHSNHNGYQLQIQLPDTVNSITDSITIVYHGKPPSGSGSFEQDFHGIEPLISTLSEPYGARDWWPCKQSLGDKIDSIDVFVETPPRCKAASNGKLVSVTENNGTKLYHWKHRYPIAAYLIAIAVTNYAEFSDYAHYNGDSVLILNYIYPEDSASSRFNIDRTVPIMEVYMNKFGKYPFFKEKYGHAQFARSGGMEHQTMGFLGFFNDMLIGHEMAHQWFGDKVTCGSWSDIWLNESFATFAEGITYEYLYPKKDLVNWRKSQVNSITSDPGGSVYVFGDDTSNSARVFDHRLSYQKGGMVLQMLRLLVGDSAFFAGMQEYLNDPKLAYGYAKTDDFRKHIESTSGMNLQKFFNDWIYFEGYPSYTITWKQSPGGIGITISQQQSLPSASYFELPVPLLLKMKGRDSLIVLYNNKNNQWYNIFVDDKIDSIIFDPDYLLISRCNKIINQTSIVDSMAPKMIIYPNPFYYSLVIYFNRGSVNMEKVQIFNLNGKLVQEINYYGQVHNPGSSVPVNTSIKQSGIYILKIITKDKTYTYPIIHALDWDSNM